MTLLAAGFVAGLIAGAVLAISWADSAARYGEHSGRVDRLIRRAQRGDRAPHALDTELERTQEIFPATEGMDGKYL